MSEHTLTDELDLARLRDRVDATLADFLHRPGRHGATAGEHDVDLGAALADFVLAPGKRLRPLLCLAGFRAAHGGDLRQALRLAACLELFHAFALIHDDVMDGSDTRRGRPSVHRAFAAHRGHRPDADAFGTSTAILLGDLALVCCDEMLRAARLSRRQADATLPLLEAMRHEVLQGQYLDLAAAGRPCGDLAQALRVIRLKTAKYTVERPLHLGAALAGAGADVLGACSAFALPLGDAFQLRDDLLGVFGDPAVTGKPVLEDLRCGKATVLMALAVQRASAAQAALLHRLVGDPRLDEDGAAEVRRVLECTGARQAVETMIAVRYGTALDALARSGFPPGVIEALRHIAARAAARDA